MEDKKNVKIRANPADPPVVPLIEPGFSPKPGSQRVGCRVWRAGLPSLSLGSPIQAKRRTASHSRIQNRITRQMDSQSNQANRAFFSDPWYFYKRTIGPGAGRFSKSARRWLGRKMTSALNLSIVLIALRLKSYP